MLWEPSTKILRSKGLLSAVQCPVFTPLRTAVAGCQTRASKHNNLATGLIMLVSVPVRTGEMKLRDETRHSLQVTAVAGRSTIAQRPWPILRGFYWAAVNANQNLVYPSLLTCPVRVYSRCTPVTGRSSCDLGLFYEAFTEQRPTRIKMLFTQVF